MFAAPMHETAEMNRHQIEPLSPTRARAGVTAAKPRIKLAENPRVEQRAAADGDAGATSLVEHARRVGNRSHVAIADDGDSLDRFDDAANPVEFHLPAEA